MKLKSKTPPSFIDTAKIWVKSGDGGAGAVHFRREKFLPKGGPDGGNGGDGGTIIIKGSNHKNTLLHLRYNKHFKAENGANGQGMNKYGENGNGVCIQVPPGTIIKDLDGNFITEILHNNQEFVIAKGGKGGLGNSFFKSSTRQAPKYAQPGITGQELTILLELKLLADVGLVGFPNAGKSSLLAALSAAKPKVGDYPFTSLVPTVGVVKYYDNTFVMADIPGIIEGAAKGKGLGLDFLRHIERNAILLFVVDIESDSIKEVYNMLLAELKAYNPDLLNKKRLLAITKVDLITDTTTDGLLKLDESANIDNTILNDIIVQDLPKDLDHVFVSSLDRKNSRLNILRNKLWNIIEK